MSLRVFASVARSAGRDDVGGIEAAFGCLVEVMRLELGGRAAVSAAVVVAFEDCAS